MPQGGKAGGVVMLSARGVEVLSVRGRWLLASGEAPRGKLLKGWAIMAVDINNSVKEGYD